MIIRSRARKVWIPYSGLRFPPPRAVQLYNIVVCWRKGHDWGRWRRETEDWFVYVDAPMPWAWRSCHRCCLIEHVR